MTEPTRHDDEILLDMLAKHVSGRTPVQIARTHKITVGTTRRRIRDVMDDDKAADYPEAHTYWRNHAI
jgi:hypothetical protein